MVKGIASGTLIFGLSEINLEKLKAGDPILFDLAELGLPSQKVFIFHGKDEDTMKQMMKDKIHPYLTTIVDKRVGDKN
jgi:hypothetical protein